MKIFFHNVFTSFSGQDRLNYAAVTNWTLNLSDLQQRFIFHLCYMFKEGWLKVMLPSFSGSQPDGGSVVLYLLYICSVSQIWSHLIATAEDKH